MDPAGGLLGLLCVLVVIVPVALWIASVILRAAVGLTNKIVGGARPSEYEYELAGYRHYPHDPAGLAIPVPSQGRAMGIVLLVGVVDFAVRMAILMAAGLGSGFGGDGGTAALIALPVSLVVHTVMLSSLLPTTLGRAFLVLVFQFVIVLLICAALGAFVVALMGGLTVPR